MLYNLIYLKHIDIIFNNINEAKAYYTSHRHEFSQLNHSAWIAFDDYI